jgi:hypothetical protein
MRAERCTDYDARGTQREQVSSAEEPVQHPDSQISQELNNVSHDDIHSALPFNDIKWFHQNRC